MTPGLFITGTNTGVGKTHVGMLIARWLRRHGYQVGVYKPVASGCVRETGDLVAEDAVQLWEAAGRPKTLHEVCPQRFAAPVAPCRAAQAEGRQVDADRLRSGLDYWLATSDIVLVEGAGGLMSPLSDSDYNATLAAEFGFPLVIVSVNELGTINATLQTLITARSVAPQLAIAGVVLNCTELSPDDESTDSNPEELRRRADVPMLATVHYSQQEFTECPDWYALASV